MHKVSKYKLDHVAFWLITVIFYAFTRKQLIDSSGWFIYLSDVLIRNVLIASICYLNIFYLFEKFFKKNRYFTYAFTLLCSLVVYTILQSSSDVWLGNYNPQEKPLNPFFYRTYYNFSIGLFYIAFTLALQLSKRWYQQQLLLHRIQAEKLETELQYLKAQLNPHFLFNCINTIYFQIDKSNKSARESLRKFSDLLRYQLYECNEDKIPIEKETGYLESYMDLQRLRKNDTSKIHCFINENVKNFDIAPLLLLPFVENAFKHLGNDNTGTAFIRLDMYMQNGHFNFCIANSTDVNLPYNPAGIGLKNARRRLDLLYENEYELEIKNDAAIYSVRLLLKVK